MQAKRENPVLAFLRRAALQASIARVRIKHYALSIMHYALRIKNYPVGGGIVVSTYLGCTFSLSQSPLGILRARCQ